MLQKNSIEGDIKLDKETVKNNVRNTKNRRAPDLWNKDVAIAYGKLLAAIDPLTSRIYRIPGMVGGRRKTKRRKTRRRKTRRRKTRKRKTRKRHKKKKRRRKKTKRRRKKGGNICNKYNEEECKKQQKSGCKWASKPVGRFTVRSCEQITLGKKIVNSTKKITKKLPDYKDFY